MALKRVRLYQDIDGCLNACYNARAWRQPEDDVNAGYSRGYVAPQYDDYGRLWEGQKWFKYKMEYNSRLIEALNSLDVEFVWTTTWREDARAVGTLMGLTPRSERVLHPLDGFTSFPSIKWKWAAILQEQELDPSPFIAVDDEWGDVSPFMRDSMERMGGLLINPDPNLGMTPADVARMRAYIDSSTTS